MKRDLQSQLKFFSWKGKNLDGDVGEKKKIQVLALIVFLETLTELSMPLEGFIHLC